MYHKPFIEHIRIRKNQGASDEEIRNELHKDGWAKEDIDQGFFYANNPKEQESFSLRRLLQTEISTPIFVIVLFCVITSSVSFFYFFGRETNNYTIVTEGAPSQEKVVFKYGVQQALSNPDFFNKVKSQLINDKVSFVEVDLSSMIARVYKEGNVTVEVKVKTKGKEGSWWETPAGLYKIQTKEKSHYSSMGHVTQPWSMEFQGNFFIHGWPKYDDGTPVSSTFSGGCIRLADEDAKKIYDAVTIGTPILVYEKDFILDSFSYEDKKPVVDGGTYLYGDMHNNFLFFEKEKEKSVPIFGITKLMTALVATEYINIEKKTIIGDEDIVPTSVPRLQKGMSIDIYQLLFPLLRESSNEAGEAIASAYGRSLFIRHMNEKAKAIGMTHTHFVDPTGVGEGNVSTAEDLFMLAKYIYNNRSFIFDITSGKVKTNTYGKSIFESLGQANSVSNLPSFFGGVSEQTEGGLGYNIAVFRLPIDGSIRPIFFVSLLSHTEKNDIIEALSYVQDRYK